jgi:hypothetical protein
MWGEVTGEVLIETDVAGLSVHAEQRRRGPLRSDDDKRTFMRSATGLPGGGTCHRATPVQQAGASISIHLADRVADRTTVENASIG